MLDKHFIELYAKGIENEINKSIRMSMEGVCRSIRNFAYDIIARQAPELDEKYRQKLLDSWIPSVYDTQGPLLKNGLVNDIPPSMMFEMIWQFVRFGIGEMSQEEVEAIQKDVGISWAERYWDNFPYQIRRLIRDVIKNNISFEIFNERLKLLLRLF